MIYDIYGNLLCDEFSGGNYTDAECTNAFLDYMAKKCTLYGMTGTYYASPSGLTQSSYSTPRDALKLGVAVTAYREALSIWATPDRNFSIGGPNARTIAVQNNVISGVATDLGTYYKFLGGKGGSLIYSDYHRAQILLVEIEGKAVVLSLMALGQTNYNNIYKSAKELCDMVKDSMDGQTPSAGTNLTALISGGGGYAACVVPNVSGAYANLETPAELLDRDNSVSAAPTANRYPASTTKTMTMLCALDYASNIHETVTVKTADIVGGSGSTFYDGDTMTLFDALRIMMMESSNTLANTIARVTGRKILALGE